ncbi:hypothetical protein M3Y98_00195000 [Aphelenchoides besseyi]|nr:hypothetical protein M3Y98_00195000 [Aphelenchoides besseyi]KAI6200246.1 hypothetical protein M3Y96_00712800 [Aphelenchoides besseyi]
MLLTSLLIVFIISETSGFKIISLSKRQLDSDLSQLLAANDDKPVYNRTCTDTKIQYAFGKQSFNIDTYISLADGNTYVFDESCKNKADSCKKGIPTNTYDTTKSGKKLEKKTYTYKVGPNNQEYKGSIFEDRFMLDKIAFETQFGVINTASGVQQLNDTYLGLGFRSKEWGFDDKTEPIFKIFEATKEKGVVIQSDFTPQHGFITFGATNHSSCLSMFLVKAEGGVGTNLAWSIKFKSVQGKKVTINNDDGKQTAVFDFDIQEIAMPIDLYKDIGSEDVPDLGNLPDIRFEFENGNVIIMTPQSSGRYKPMIADNEITTGFRLGTIFLRNRCIVLNGEDLDHPKVGISYAAPIQGAETASLSVVLVATMLFVSIQLFKFSFFL